jgi:hypothetical protein
VRGKPWFTRGPPSSGRGVRGCPVAYGPMNGPPASTLVRSVMPNGRKGVARPHFVPVCEADLSEMPVQITLNRQTRRPAGSDGATLGAGPSGCKAGAHEIRAICLCRRERPREKFVPRPGAAEESEARGTTAFRSGLRSRPERNAGPNNTEPADPRARRFRWRNAMAPVAGLQPSPHRKFAICGRIRSRDARRARGRA